jgi:hypothetical protein
MLIVGPEQHRQTAPYDCGTSPSPAQQARVPSPFSTLEHCVYYQRDRHEELIGRKPAT